MDFKQVTEAARPRLGSVCKGCVVCNGKACSNQIPGPGAKGLGDTAIRNFEAWSRIRVNMDTLFADEGCDTTCSLFGRTFRLPLFAGPVGAVQLHYGDTYTDESYNQALVLGCAQSGIAAFTGDGTNPNVMQSACRAIGQQEGCGIPTIKPWSLPVIEEKLALCRLSKAFAVAMDVDAAGLPFLKGQTPPAGAKSQQQLHEIIQLAGDLPFIVKGIMTVKGAEKAIDAGAAAIVVSNHGGRVLDGCAATAEVLPEIAKAAQGRCKVLVDGGIRTGTDLFKALALGADAVLVARPYVTAVYGAGSDGVQCLTEKFAAELADTMTMCGASSLKQISRDMVRL
ncbi:MAG: alpha-hydroxy-acid oxidizing protein [Pygmaiobacter massiliensis]|nr:alpha-hydroxy-acid oxidizing protein [Pygmaiobacter massiliensis]